MNSNITTPTSFAEAASHHPSPLATHPPNQHRQPHQPTVNRLPPQHHPTQRSPSPPASLPCIVRPRPRSPPRHSSPSPASSRHSSGPWLPAPVRNKKRPRDTSTLHPKIVSLLGEHTRRRRRPDTFLAVTSTDVSISLASVHTSIRQAINPLTDGIRVRRMTKNRSGKILLVAHSPADAEKILHHPALTSRGLRIERLTKSPKLIIYDVASDVTSDNLKQALWHHNPRLHSELTPDSLDAGIYHLHPASRKTPGSVNWILTVSLLVRNAIRRTSSLFLGWQRCRVLDYLRPERCFRCLDLGHVARYCTADATCIHCGGAHERIQCPRPDDSPRCGPCHRRCKDAHHSFNDNNCPLYLQAMTRLLAQTKYSGQ